LFLLIKIPENLWFSFVGAIPCGCPSSWLFLLIKIPENLWFST